MTNRWSAIFLGTIVGIACKLMLILLGVGVGLLVFPFERAGENWVWHGLAVSSGVYLTVAIVVSYFIGGTIASRGHFSKDRGETCFQGLGVWGTTFVLFAILGVASFLSTLPAAQTGMGAIAAVEMVNRTKPRIVTDLSLLKGKAVTSLDFGVSAKQLAQAAEEVAATPQAKQALEATRKGVTAVSLLSFGAMLLAMLASIAGAFFGSSAPRELESERRLARLDIKPAV